MKELIEYFLIWMIFYALIKAITATRWFTTNVY